MAGIGIRLNRIFNKNTLTTNIYGFFYSTVVTIAPMLLVIGAILVMQIVLGASRTGYAGRELFAATVLYIFIFSLLTVSPFLAVLSKYMSDIIYEEKFEDILPCYYVGLIMSVLLAVLLGVPFCLWEYFVGEVGIHYVFAGFGGYMSLVIVFYSMLYLLICKDYKKISFFFLISMLVTVILSYILVKWFRVGISFAMLVSLDVGFLLVASFEVSLVRSYFRENSGQYKRVLSYFRQFWQLIFTNFFYILGLYIHNFVFWTTEMRMIVVKSFVMMQPYDMASCLAMFTNISASVIFIARVEMHFHERYRIYSEMVIGGRGMDIENAKKRMFRQISEELNNLVRIQFIVSVVVFFMAVIILPQFGFGGMVMRIYPCLAAGYFILFTMYNAIIFLYYFSDLKGALLTALTFCVVTLIGSIFTSHLSELWYGAGVVIGSFAGWWVAYARLRWLEKNLDVHIFCNGNIIGRGHGKRPSSKVFDRYQGGQAVVVPVMAEKQLAFYSAALHELTDELQNPARGWFQMHTFLIDREPDLQEVAACLNKEETCVRILMNIGAYRNRNLDESALAHMEQILAFFEEQGQDIILRIAYDTDGRGMEHDPSLFSQILLHLQQLKPILQKYRNQIVLLEGMLVGSWGEMHSSRFLSKKYILQMHEALEDSAAGIMRAVRQPAQWRILHQDFPSKETRVGLYNDAIFGSETDLGTFAAENVKLAGWESAWSRRNELVFEDVLGTFVPQSGEAVYGREYRNYNLALTVERLQNMHLTYLNGVYDEMILDIWKKWIWEEPGIWNGVSGYDYIGRHLGYRFCIRSATAKIIAGHCEITLEIENIGFSGFYQEAEVWLVQVDAEGQKQEYQVNWDVRKCASGQTRFLTWKIPADEGRVYLSVRRKWDQKVVWFANESTEQGWVLVGEIR